MWVTAYARGEGKQCFGWIRHQSHLEPPEQANVSVEFDGETNSLTST